MNEIWRAIKDYEGLYEVSNEGRIKSLARYSTGRKKRNISERFLSLREDDDGYLSVKLSKNGISKIIRVHRLVALAFVDGYFKNAEVNHKDCNRKNNKCTNLEWVTHEDNIQYSITHGNHISLTKRFGCSNPNYGNNKLSRKYSENKELSKEKQSRKGSKNGRAKPLIAIFPNGNKFQFEYIGEFAKYLVANNLIRSKNIDGIRDSISRSVKKGEDYHGITIEYIR